MPDDLDLMFEDAFADSDVDAEVVDNLPTNATIHTGDEDVEDVSNETSDTEVDDDDIEDIDADEDSDEEPEVDEDVSDEPSEFDFEAIKDQLVEITVRGQTSRVPLAELRNGYMRQADYTQKTQQVAADMQVVNWAKEMQSAFAKDPAATIRELQEHFGLVDDSDDEYADLDPEVQPLAKAVKAQEREIVRLQRAAQANAEAAQQSQVQAGVRAELEAMKSTYADFDPQIILPMAIEQQLTMVQAYKIWKADQTANGAKVTEATRAKADEAAERRAKAKRVAAKTTKGGSNKSTSGDDSWKSFDTFEELFEFESNKS